MAGTARDLLIVLKKMADEHDLRSKEWPSSAIALGSTLRRIAPCLRAVDVQLEFGRAKDAKRTRIINITAVRTQLMLMPKTA